jgi:hypothetical protein
LKSSKPFDRRSFHQMVYKYGWLCYE